MARGTALTETYIKASDELKAAPLWEGGSEAAMDKYDALTLEMLVKKVNMMKRCIGDKEAPLTRDEQAYMKAIEAEIARHS